MIAIDQVGMVTSVGRDAHTTMSSIACGIARPKELGYFTVVDPELQEPEGVIGHPIVALTEGFHLFGLWVRLGLKCLDDLLARAALPRGAAAWQRAALIAVTPDIRSARFMSDGDESIEALRAPFLDRLAAWLGIPATAEHVHAVAIGNTGLFPALELASGLIERRTVDRVVVLAVDSLLDTLTLEWLSAAHRLKSATVPAGLMPGEAAAALLLGRAGGAGLDVAVRAVAAETQAQDPGETSAARGARLARVLGRCLPSAADPTGADSVLVSDQNGEQWRAEEYGYCGLQLGEAWPARAHVVLPALSVGDTGAASAALACCVGALAVRQQAALVRQSLILGSSIEGRAGAALLSATH
jgi:3-oxoacyl-[acyl-carrier-protein] synthase-1